MFLRLLLDYVDIIYDLVIFENFKYKLESIQHKDALTITDAVRGTSTEKHFNELGFEILADRR